jgi:hypothetical protein
MKGKCFEIGTIQAFLDGETTPEVSLRLTEHVASCDECAHALAVADEENSIVFSALERELNTLVPTQRLWTRINDTITVEGRPSFWQKVAAHIRASFASPSIVSAAGIVLFAGMFAVLWLPRTAEFDTVNAPQGPIAVPTNRTETVDLVAGDPRVGTPEPVAASVPAGAIDVKESNHSPEKLRRMITTADHTRPVDVPSAQYADAYFPGEESYVKTIADLKESVDDQKDTVLTPSTRVSYERDMAVVNDSIKRMREVVKKNPRNQAARQVLYSSYQDKIDLLNSVAQREELIASLK